MDDASRPPRRRRDSYDRRDDGRDERSLDSRRPRRRKEHGSSRHSRSSRRHRDDSSASSPDKDRTRRHGRDRSRPRHRRSRSRDAPRDRDRDRDRDRRRRYADKDRSDRRRSRSRSASPARRSKHARSRSRDANRSKPSRSKSPQTKRSGKALPSQEDAYRGNDATAVVPATEKQKPNHEQTGLLAKESNTVAGTNIVLKYNEPADARKPPASEAWRMYVFKGADVLDTVELGSQSCWLVGREAAVADLLVQHPSTSKQHAVIQFRHTVRTNEFGDKESKVRPYLIDLESANGSVLNGERVEPSRYVEIMDKDVVKFGLSEREYVIMLPPPEA
ncbi:SMAD/FHA domain-containing protein [Saccharata proteae CBS 121410]|uniref:SMAD/FHA domain-containing protein n=1 Tax=Saccharata proteae CBS 121410 TaxID=1314787 RepID=A0A9P4HUQ7_9PEZI|nr:SMAD/FHA domain-containing protein [Saccharata proteae CBS 121410]